jgi:transposase
MVPPASDFSACFYLCIFTPPFSVLLLYRIQSQHVTPKLDEFLIANRDRLLLVPLPTYSPHLNVVDTIWRYMRDKLTRNYFYPTFNEKCEAWVQWLQALPFERFQSLIGVPENFAKDIF